MTVSALRYSGFSLIEIIIVTALAGIIIMVISNLAPAVNLIGAGNHESVAKQIMAKQLDDVRSKGFDNLANGSTAITDSRLTSLFKGSGSLLIEDCPNQICTTQQVKDSVKKITVTINWDESGKSKSINIVTLISKGGIN